MKEGDMMMKMKKRKRYPGWYIWILCCGLLFSACGKAVQEATPVVETIVSLESEETIFAEETESLAESESDWEDETIETIDAQMEERSPSASGMLEKSLKYVEIMDSAKYTAESWNAFLTVYDYVVAEYNAGASDTKCDSLQKKLELAKSKLAFIAVEDSVTGLPFYDMEKEQLRQEMGYGWNLEDTKGASKVDNTIWRNPDLNSEWFQIALENGFRTVRVTIDAECLVDEAGIVSGECLDQIQWIVDQATGLDLYVILSITYGINDEGWSNLAVQREIEVYEQYENIWREVAYLFRDYDEHLIFESLQGMIPRDQLLLENKLRMTKNMNQMFVNLVRSTGSNNGVRWLSVPGRYQDGKVLPGGNWGFTLPKDLLENSHIFVADHFDHKCNVANRLSTLRLPVVNSFVMTEDTITMRIGEKVHKECLIEPAKYQAGVLWKTEDPTVATVNQGWIQARVIGETTLTAYLPNHSEAVSFPVVVEAMEPENSITIYEAESENTWKVGEIFFLHPENLFSEIHGPMQYRVSEPSIVFVNRLGMCRVLAEGEADIIIQDCYGDEAVVKLIAAGADVEEQTTPLNLAVNVLYHDEELGYQGNEVGQPQLIEGKGQYTVVFDCGSDLSSEAVKAGVTGLKHLTAIYIKDYSVTSGETTVSTPSICDIKYDMIEVDGVQLTLKDREIRSAIKSSGIIDTNGPLNSWGDIAVKEIDNVDHVLDFVGIENPQKIAITFTITRLEE